MELGKTLVLSLFMHMCVFTAAILLSFNLAGGSSKNHDRTVVIVRIIGGLNEGKAEDPVRIKRPLHKKAPTHGRFEHKEKAITALRKRIETAQEMRKETRMMADAVVSGTSEQALNRDTTDTGVKGLAEEGQREDHVMGEEDLLSSSNNEVTPPLTGGTTGEEKTAPAEIIELIRSSIEKAKLYPVVARKRGIEGTVYVSFRINRAGFPEDIKITRTSGSKILDRGAVRIIRKAGTFPYIEGMIEVPISFRLRSAR